jgi:hypothetical protein
MIRIVGVQRDSDVQREFLLLQNQSAMRQMLRGHAVVGEGAFTASREGVAHLFADEEWIGPGAYVLLFTGTGISRWSRTKDGAPVYVAYMAGRHPAWAASSMIHVLHISHSYVERKTAPLSV